MRILISIFGAFWMFIVLIDYFNKHPIHLRSFEFFSFGELLIGILTLIGIGISYNKLVLQKSEKAPKIPIGLSILGLALIIGIVSIYAYTLKFEMPGGIVKSILFPLLKCIISLCSLLLLVSSSIAWGILLNKVLDVQVQKSSQFIIWCAAGLMILTFMFFILGSLQFLNAVSMIVVIVIPIIFSYQNILNWIHSWLIDTPSTKLNISNPFIAVLIFLLTALIINFIYIQIPFPPGFDSRNYYMNISQLIGQESGLVSGFQPYNWSLLMSYGYVIFNSPAIGHSVSFLGLLLSIWAVFDLVCNYLKLSKFDALLICTLFTITPSVMNQLFIELKVDLGLLFIQLASIIILINAIKSENDKNRLHLFILLGLISGYALGIKLTHVYLLFGIVALLWYKAFSIRGFMGMFLFIFFVIFLTKLDNISGLNKYHLGVSFYKWGLLLGSIVLLIPLYLKGKTKFLKTSKELVILSSLSILTFSPWMIKNTMNTKGPVSIDNVLLGSNPGPKINLKIIEDNYRKANNRKNRKN